QDNGGKALVGLTWGALGAMSGLISSNNGGGVISFTTIDSPLVEGEIVIEKDSYFGSCIVVTVSPAVNEPAGDTLSFGGIEQNKTVVCNRGTVNISGMTNTIEIQGDCARVSVSGMNNILTVETAQRITASGFDNQVTYRAGTPEISTSGSGNVVQQG
ncbi:MAG: DUF3060 domain-containing protein, partial [Mycobacterium sp.]|nr:DUF3060 domain-containing protein [Mycobacterium sp.]